MNKVEWLERLFKENDQDTYKWKTNVAAHPGTRMEVLQSLKNEKELLKEAWKQVTGKEWAEAKPDIESIVNSKDEGGDGGNGRELVHVR